MTPGNTAHRASFAPSSRRGSIAIAALWLLVVVAPELLGGVYPWGILVIAALALLAAGAALWAHGERVPAWSAIDLCMLAPLLLTVLQALPLPCALTRLLAPQSAHALARTRALLGMSEPTLCALSRDPGATREEILKGVAIVAAYLAARILIAAGARKRVVEALAGAGVVLGVVALAHAASAATRVFGVYQPLEVSQQPLVAPLVNLNTLGGALTLSACASAALALSAARTRPRVLWILATMTSVAACLLTRSRGAVGALVLGFGLLSLHLLRTRQRAGHVPLDPRQLLGRAAAPAALAVSLALLAYGSYDDIAHEFRGGRWDKLLLIGKAATFSLEQPWLGIGRGAFASAFAAASVGTDSRRFDHPENLLVQWATEWGIPLAVAVAAVLALALGRGLWRARSTAQAAAAAGLIALAVQNLVDLGLELVGVAVLAAVALPCATASRRARATQSPAPRARARVFLAAGVLALGVLGPATSRDHRAYAEDDLRDALDRNQRAEFRERLSSAARAHPAAPSLAILAASEALKHRDRSAPRWINRALELAPGWPGPHLLAAQWLWNTGHTRQAVLELALGLRPTVAWTAELVCQMAHAEAEAFVAVADRSGRAEEFLEMVAGCLPATSPEALLLDAAILARFPSAPGPRLRAATRLLAEGKAELALQTLRNRGATGRSSSVQELKTETEALLALERADEASQVVAAALRGEPSSGVLWTLAAHVSARQGDQPGLGEALSRLRGLSESSEHLASTYRLEAQSMRALGKLGAALRAQEEAYRLSGHPGDLSATVELAQRLGDPGRAERARARLCSHHPDAPGACPAHAPPPAAATAKP